MPISLTDVLINHPRVFIRHLVSYREFDNPLRRLESDLRSENISEEGLRGFENTLRRRSEVRERALAFDSIEDRNGIFFVSLDDGVTTCEIQLYTAQRGTFQGKRLVKYRTPQGRFKAFAFLNANRTITVWSRFEGEEFSDLRDAARALIDIQGSGMWQPQTSSTGAFGSIRITVHQRSCLVCNAQVASRTGGRLCYEHSHGAIQTALIRGVRDQGINPNVRTRRPLDGTEGESVNDPEEEAPPALLLSELGTGLIR